MYLRKLKQEDAPYMLEWMHDQDVIENLHADFASKSIEDVERFIHINQEFNDEMNLAIAADNDEYMGTVSLKHIDRDTCEAEFAISVRRKSMGKGFSWFGMKSIINIAFDDLKLKRVYWCVSKNNIRAIRFYEKHSFSETSDISMRVLNRYVDVGDLKWYSVSKGTDLSIRNKVAGCRIINIKTITTTKAGELSFFESNKDIPFDIKRIYYISGVPEGVRRGFHAHKTLKQLLFCPCGSVQIILDNGITKEEIDLSNPSVGILIEQPTWREMLWLQEGSVLFVAASDYYDEQDYIRVYSDYKKYIGE